MRTTREERDQRRAETWLLKSGGLDHVSPEAFDLLRSRLRARQRARWIGSPLPVLALLLVLSQFNLVGDSDYARRYSGRYLLAIGLLMGWVLLVAELGRRADHRIGTTLATRLTRDERVSWPRLFGRPRLIFLIVATSVEVIFAIGLAIVAPGGQALDFAIGLGAACALAGLGIGRAMSRETIALDDVSLAIDQRLRSDEAFSASVGLYLVVFVVPGSSLFDLLPFWFGEVWVAGVLVILALQAWGRSRPPWKSAGGLRFRTAGY
jgi:hypothetical protein